MNSKLIKVIGSLIVVLIFGIFGLLKFIKYGASNCDANGKLCDCFCCNLFGGRGYEACGNYGFLVGVGIGLVVISVIYLVIKKYETKQYETK